MNNNLKNPNILKFEIVLIEINLKRKVWPRIFNIRLCITICYTVVM